MRLLGLGNAFKAGHYTNAHGFAAMPAVAWQVSVIISEHEAYTTAKALADAEKK